MRTSKYSTQQKNEILKEAAASGVSFACRKYGVSDKTIYFWKRQIKTINAKAETHTHTPVHATNGTVVEVTIPEHVIRAAAAKYLQDKLGIKLVQF